MFFNQFQIINNRKNYAQLQPLGINTREEAEDATVKSLLICNDKDIVEQIDNKKNG
jgi:hypothetical protein